MGDESYNFWMQIYRLDGLIRASELKAGLVISFHSLIVGVFFDRLDSLTTTFHGSTAFVVIVCLWFLFVGISIYYAIKCFIPRMELKFDRNVFFFIDVVNKYGGLQEFNKTMMEINNDEKVLFTQLCEQIFIGSKITAEKFKNVQRSIKFLAYSFVFVLAAVGLWLIDI